MLLHYHIITTWRLPFVKLFTKQLQQIHTSLQVGSPDIEVTYNYFFSRQVAKEYHLVCSNHIAKLQEVPPNWVHMHIHHW